MPSLVAMLHKNPFATWMCSVLAFGLAGIVVIFFSYNEFLDCSIPETHESANTPFGWTTAAIATGVPLLVGIVLGLRHSTKLVGAAVLVAAVQASVWVWALNPGGCDWALAVSVQITRLRASSKSLQTARSGTSWIGHLLQNCGHVGSRGQTLRRAIRTASRRTLRAATPPMTSAVVVFES